MKKPADDAPDSEVMAYIEDLGRRARGPLRDKMKPPKSKTLARLVEAALTDKRSRIYEVLKDFAELGDDDRAAELASIEADFAADPEAAAGLARIRELLQMTHAAAPGDRADYLKWLRQQIHDDKTLELLGLDA